jgi:Lrp/AsnC family leucine-responsive transcriptional regulator
MLGFSRTRFLQLCAVESSTAHETCNIATMNAPTELDAIDLHVLRALQADGRATYDELAEKVGLSASATLRRVRRLEDTGVIAGYVALVRADRVGLALTAYINVRLEKHTESHKRSPMDAFRASVQAWPEVVECASLTGDMDYLLRVVVADMAHYSRFVMDTLLKHPSVQDCKTSFVLDRVKTTTALPL